MGELPPADDVRPRRPGQLESTDWSQAADWYDKLVGDEGSEFHRQIVHPGVLKLLGVVKDKTILDVACGQGVLCRLLHGQGAKIFGIDAAIPLIELARKRGPAEIRYARVDAREIDAFTEFATAQFDAATCILAAQNFNPLEPMFASAARLLKPGGKLVMVIVHPCFRGPKETSWGWDHDAFVQYRRVDKYLLPRKEPIITNPGKKDGKYTWTFHRPLEAYVSAAVRGGLLVDALQEWASHKFSDSGPRAAAENSARREIPMFMALRFTRPIG